MEGLNAGEISRRGAAKVLNIGYATLKRLLEQLQVNHFLQTLAEIALAVASRQASLAGGKLD